MSKNQSYSPEFRAEAVKLVLEQGWSQVAAAKRLAIPKGPLKNWVAVAKPGDSARPGALSVVELEAENARLRKGNCHDNAPMERFWGSLKNELVHHRRFATRAEVQTAVQECIEIFYNRQRRLQRLRATDR